MGFNFLNNENDNGYNGMNPEDIPPEVWVPDRALEVINMERQVNPEISDVGLANKILRDNLAVIAVGITHTAKYSSDARLRFQAQTYVMDRVMGKVGTTVVTDDSPIDDLNKQLISIINGMIAPD